MYQARWSLTKFLLISPTEHT